MLFENSFSEKIRHLDVCVFVSLECVSVAPYIQMRNKWNAVLPILYCCAVLQKYEQNTSAFFSKFRMPDWQIYGQNKGFCELGYNQSVIELFAQLINNTFTCTKLQNTGKITQTLI